MPLTKWQPPARRHEVVDDGRVTWLELFFDLVYVAALIQLGDRLADNVTWSGVAAFVGAFVILWWTWTGTTAYTNQFAVDDIVHRLLAFVQMFAVGNVAVLAARNPENWETWLVFAYVGARLPLLAMYWRARAAIPYVKATAELFLRFFGAGATIWLVSLLVPTPARYAVWVLALLVEFSAPVSRFRRPDAEARAGQLISPSYAEHFQERYALFTIIVLGETFVKTLTEIGNVGISATTQVFGGMAFLMLIALWWTYFDDVADAHIRPTSAIAPTAQWNRLIWVYTHLPLAIGITAFGVGAKKVVGVEDVADTFKGSYTWLLVGALITTLIAVAVLDLVTVSPHFAIDAPERIGPRVVASVALVPIAVLLVTGTVSALVGLGLVTAVVVGQIAVEVIMAHRSEHRLDHQVRTQIGELAGACEHLVEATAPSVPADHTCRPCAEKGLDPVQLRWCLTCGHTACCDDSVGRHATSHYEETGHPVMASAEAGATWAYCYVHEVTDPEWRTSHQ